MVLVEEPLAAAVGRGSRSTSRSGNLIVDIGGGMTEMAVASMGGVVSGTSIRIGGFDLDTAIQEHIRSEYDVAIGEKSAEGQDRDRVGVPGAAREAAIVTGRALATGAPTEIRVTEDEIRQAMSDPVGKIVEAARTTVAEAPPELTHDVLESGMFLTGGGGLLRGLDLLLSQECEVPVPPSARARPWSSASGRCSSTWRTTGRRSSWSVAAEDRYSRNASIVRLIRCPIS